MAVLQAAADEWKEKCNRWFQYCQEQHYAHVYPVFVVQVENGKNGQLSETNLDDCVKKIEEQQFDTILLKTEENLFRLREIDRIYL